MRYLIVILLLIPVVAGAAVNEWVLGEPTFAQDNDEWVLGGPFVEIDDTVVDAGGGQVINVIMSSISLWFVVFVVCKKRVA